MLKSLHLIKFSKIISMKKNLQKNIFLFKEHIGLFKASNNYDIYDPKTKEIILHCREKNLNPMYKIVRMFLTETDATAAIKSLL